MATKKTIFSCLVLLMVFSTLSHALPVKQLPEIDAIYQFGDSISDTGNLIREAPIGTHSSFTKLPYGQTFFHKPTGRCSNGLLMVDFFARYFSLPFLDAYLNKDGYFAHGVNFAVAGSTALDASNLAAKNISSPVTKSSLSVQLSWFRTHLESICSNPSDCKDKLANALFIIETGGNDFNYAFLERKSVQDVYLMVPEVVQTIKSAVKEVIDLGATRVVIPGNFPIGCLPIYLSTFKTDDPTMYDGLNCINFLNEFAKFQNNQLQQAIKELQEDHPNVAIVYGDYFNALQGLLQNAASLGFDKEGSLKACCGASDNDYSFNITKMCGSDGGSVCEFPRERVSWDGIHMTQHAYRVMAKWLFKRIARGISNAV